MVTRRTVVIRALTAGAVAALPTGHVAAALAAEHRPEPIPIAPGVDVLSADPLTDDAYAAELVRILEIVAEVNGVPVAIVRTGNYVRAVANGAAIHGYVTGGESCLTIQAGEALDHLSTVALLSGAMAAMAKVGGVAA